MIKTSTYIFAFFMLIFTWLLREKKHHELKIYEDKIKAEQRINEKNVIIDSLKIVNDLKEEIIIKDHKEIDSLKSINKVQEYKINTTKKKLNNENTIKILSAPDTTVLRILSKHHINTYNN